MVRFAVLEDSKLTSDAACRIRPHPLLNEKLWTGADAALLCGTRFARA